MGRQSIIPTSPQEPGKQLLQAVRARFVARGRTLHGWCRAQGVDYAYAHRALTGELDFPAARKLRRRIVAASAKIGGAKR